MSAERSQSRGRDNFTSSGRGGFGNIHHTVDLNRPEDGPDDFSPTRGREHVVHPDKVMSTGRGGAGNIRSTSRGFHEPVGPDALEQGIVRREAERVEVFSTGRGGMGNMSRSRSRDPGRTLEEQSGTTVRSRSTSRDPEHRDKSKEKHGVAGLLHKVVHPLSSHHEHHHVDGAFSPRDPNAPGVPKDPFEGAPLDGTGMGLKSAPGVTRGGLL